MAKNITVKYDEQMMKYQLDIISNHYCKSIIPASVAHVDGEYIVTYHMEGFRPVKANMATLQLMKLLLKVNELLEDLQDHLFFQGDYVLSVETLFYNPRLD